MECTEHHVMKWNIRANDSQHGETTTCLSNQQHAPTHSSSPFHDTQAVTFLAIPVCAVKAFVDLNHEHEHGEDAPGYPYLRIRSKEFPWGDNGLFETEH